VVPEEETQGLLEATVKLVALATEVMGVRRALLVQVKGMQRLGFLPMV